MDLIVSVPEFTCLLTNNLAISILILTNLYLIVTLSIDDS